MEPAALALSVPVATPFASVGAAGWVRTTPVPAAARVTARPLTGKPLASRAVTVMVLVTAPVLVLIELGLALTVLCVALTPPTVAVAVNGTGLPLKPEAVAASVFSPSVGPSVQAPTAAMPFASGVCVAPLTLPPPLVTVNVTLMP